MVTGTFSFLIFIFMSPQQAIMHKFEGYWLVVEDHTGFKRKYWNRVFVFEKCSREDASALNCREHYGWVDEQHVVTNLLDINYIKYGVEKLKTPETKRRRALIVEQYFDFVLNINTKTLELSDPETGEIVMVLVRR